MNDKISIFNRSFWDLWFQKVMRNVASIKYQFMLIFVSIVIYGMFFEKTTTGEPFINAALGLGFLGGGFITLVTSRIVVRTSLVEPKSEEELDTDR